MNWFVCLSPAGFSFPPTTNSFFVQGFVDESRIRLKTKSTCWSTCVRRRVRNWISKRKLCITILRNLWSASIYKGNIAEVNCFPYQSELDVESLWSLRTTFFSPRLTNIVTLSSISPRTQNLHQKVLWAAARKTCQYSFSFSCLHSLTQKMKIDLLSLFWLSFRFVGAHANSTGINVTLSVPFSFTEMSRCRVLCSRNPLIHENVFALMEAFRFLLKS